MSSSLGEAVLDLAADASGLVTDINKARPQALGALQALGVAGGALLAAGIMVAAAAIAAITGLIWSSANTLDAAYDNIQTRTGATGAELETLKADFEAVFTSVPADAQTVSDAIGILNSRLGLTGTELQNLAAPLIEVTRITGGDLATNAEALTRLMGDWSIPAEQGAGALDMVFAASQNTGVGMDSLMQLMVQFGAPMRLFGFSFEQSAAMLSKWEQEGVNTELVMGSLRIAAGNFANQNIDLATGLEQTAEKIKNAASESEALAIGMDVFGARAGPDMVAAIREGRFEIDDLVAVLQNADGAIMSTSEATMDWGERLQIFKNQVTTAFAPAGQKLMDVATQIMAVIAEVFERPDVQAALMAIADWIGEMAEKGAAYIPIIVDAFFNFVSFLQNNQGIVIAVLAAIGVAVAAFVYTTVIPAAIAAIAALWPILLVMAAVAAIAYLVYEAWTNNWGGIQTKLTALWAQIQPIFAMLIAWLQINIPIALNFLANIWNTVLLPAIMAVWGWMSTVLFPFLQAVGHVISEVIGFAVAVLAALWETTLWPALKKVIGWMETNLLPVVKKVASFFNEELKKAFAAIEKIIKGITEAIKEMIDWLNKIQLPDDLTPGSPTPFEIGLRGIHDALMDINRLSLPTFSSQLSAVPVDAMTSAGVNGQGAEQAATNVYLYGARIGGAGRDTKISDILDFLNLP